MLNGGSVSTEPTTTETVTSEPATSGSRGGGATEAMASPKRQTREAKLCFGLPQTGQWVYLVSTESTDFTGFVT